MSEEAAAIWADAALATALFATDPVGCRGIVLRARAGPVRACWLAHAEALLAPDTLFFRLPPGIGDERLLGGLDLAATLQAGRPVAQSGILAQADGGVIVIGMAERLPPALAARLATVLDTGEVAVARDGIERRQSTMFGIIAIDEGAAEDERAPAALSDRLAFYIDLDAVALGAAAMWPHCREAIIAARRRLPNVALGEDMLSGLGRAAATLGIASLRAVLLAAKVARAAAALDGRVRVSHADAAVAGRLVLAPRAVVLPPAEAPADSAEAAERVGEPRSPDGSAGAVEQGQEEAEGGDCLPVEDIVLAATTAALPSDLLAQLRAGPNGRAPRPAAGRSQAMQYSDRRGRPAGVRRGELRGANRLNIIETLRAAAPWQRLRRRSGMASPYIGQAPRIEVRREDFRITRLKEQKQATAIFVVDASGSSALHRLAEAKGAVELLLAECYIRRDRVALIAFRAFRAELLLPPTRSLARARRSLAGLPGGGGTPLASGIDAAAALAESERRRGGYPAIVLLTDGNANVARDGRTGRAAGTEDAIAAARQLRRMAPSALLIDTAPRPQQAAARLAAEMNAVYLPLPFANADAIAQTVHAQGILTRVGRGGARGV